MKGGILRSKKGFADWVETLNGAELFLFDFEQYIAEELFDDLLIVYRSWKKQPYQSDEDSLYLFSDLLSNVLKRFENQNISRELRAVMVLKMFFVLEMDLKTVSRVLKERKNTVQFLFRSVFNQIDQQQDIKKSRDEIHCEMFAYEYFVLREEKVIALYSRLKAKKPHFAKKLALFEEKIVDLKNDSRTSAKLKDLERFRAQFSEKLNSRFFDPWTSPLFSWKKVLWQVSAMTLAVYILVNFPTGDQLRNVYWPQFVSSSLDLKLKAYELLGIHSNFTTEENLSLEKALGTQKVLVLNAEDLLKASQDIEYIVSQFQVKAIEPSAPMKEVRSSYELEFYIKEPDFLALEKALASSKMAIHSSEEVLWKGDSLEGFLPVKLKATQK